MGHREFNGLCNIAKSEITPRNWYPLMKQDHLVCFLGGSFLLGITEGGRKHIDWRTLDDKDHLDYLAGTGIIDSCTESYNTATYVDSRSSLPDIC